MTELRNKHGVQKKYENVLIQPLTQFTYCEQSSYVVGWALHGYTRLSLICHVLAVTRSLRCSAMSCVSPLPALFALSLSVSLLHPQRPTVCIRECKREDRTTAQQVAQRIELDRCTLTVAKSAGSPRQRGKRRLGLEVAGGIQASFTEPRWALV